MSASEKLRALTVERNERASAVSPMYAQAWLAVTVERALPLIADVVEAAENQEEPSQWLINSLYALAEHLEGGDE